MVSPFLCNSPKGTYIESCTFSQVLVFNQPFFVVPPLLRVGEEANFVYHNYLIDSWRMTVQGLKPRYNVVCKKKMRGVILLGRFLAKYNPNGKEDTPHVRIFMEGYCT
jgi:hypothetical protein